MMFDKPSDRLGPPSSAARLLELRDVHAGYDNRDVLHGVTMEVGEAEFVCVIGANTAGKSTLLRAVSRIVPRCKGQIAFAGRDLSALKPHEIPTLGIAHVPEGRHVFTDMSVEENLLLGGYSRRRERSFLAPMERVFHLFPRLAERRRQRAGTMSGGEQQMVAIGRALMLSPRLLILDEPSHGLAPLMVEELHRAVVEINRAGTAILLVEQNTALALSVAGRGYVLQSGRVVLEGTSADLATIDDLRAAYLGI
ncbi:ABC transporter ATP-binding protein [Aminobacter aminovorans]|jgi:branched-chain amino acid transport system ATP-binding protein|uniref:Amino acid ABC transporter ATPase n=1 Tax=Aminobacter aminovorans TaxID=83263 RepID=A0AAC9ATS3_AMIAI|nr:ABC transporter ATP-binding protein [Aminobacter aminovorans]AMS45178.1 amino acid ABC transporter ATPase [Aminobacter aminovorans]MBB3705064.1 branched-chain amino acid transport system ATP-binding protein [Aminobacter aminovorans]